MFVIQDETSGIETYGGGRYIYCDLEPDGTVVIDFNKVYNPPCALNPYATCPLPAERDTLPIASTRSGKRPITGRAIASPL